MKSDPLKRIQKQLRQKHYRLRSWRKVASEYDKSGDVLNGAMIRLIASGRDPKRADIRRALGLPVYMMVITCSKCGKLHRVFKTCDPKSRIYQRDLHGRFAVKKR
mgnify:CR=1 FL=1